MKITFDELIKEKKWLHSEIMRSIPHELITKATEDRFYEVKLLINDVVVEPTMFNDIVNNVEKYVDKEAISVVKEKFGEKMDTITESLNQLTYLIDEVKGKISEEFNIDLDED